MSRVIQGPGFTTWEAFATTGPYGLPRPGRIAFHCRSQGGGAPRVVEIDGDKADAERAVRSMEESELVALLDEARVLT